MGVQYLVSTCCLPSPILATNVRMPLTLKTLSTCFRFLCQRKRGSKRRGGNTYEASVSLLTGCCLLCLRLTLENVDSNSNRSLRLFTVDSSTDIYDTMPLCKTERDKRGLQGTDRWERKKSKTICPDLTSSYRHMTKNRRFKTQTHTHTHTHIQNYFVFIKMTTTSLPTPP